MAYGLTDLRKIVRYNARNAKDSTEYPDEQLDFALQRAMREWVRVTKCTRTLSTVNLTAGTSALPSLPSGFFPEYLLNAYLTLSGQKINPELQVVSYEALLEAQYCGNNAQPLPNGKPYLLAFYNRTNGVVGPNAPDQAYVVNLDWFAQPTTWTAGADPTTVTSFNLDDDHLEMIAIGASGLMQEAEPENADRAAKKIAEFRGAQQQFKARGSGGQGTQVIQRENPGWMRGGGCR